MYIDVLLCYNEVGAVNGGFIGFVGFFRSEILHGMVGTCFLGSSAEKI